MHSGLSCLALTREQLLECAAIIKQTIMSFPE